LNVQPRRKLTQHLPYSDVIAKLSKHFYRLDPENEGESIFEKIETVMATPITESESGQ